MSVFTGFRNHHRAIAQKKSCMLHQEFAALEYRRIHYKNLSIKTTPQSVQMQAAIAEPEGWYPQLAATQRIGHLGYPLDSSWSAAACRRL
jgi:hypothetical protein